MIPTAPPRPSLPAAAFTLIELILVMAMLVVVLAVAAPSLSQFFKGRNLDLEAHRLLALTRHGHARAVTEGIPMLLWIDARQRLYGLQAESSYVESDPRAVAFALHDTLELEVETLQSPNKPPFESPNLTGAVATATIRFQPDGFLGDTSPRWVVLRDAEKRETWLGLSRNRLAFEIYTNGYAQAVNQGVLRR